MNWQLNRVQRTGFPADEIDVGVTVTGDKLKRVPARAAFIQPMLLLPTERLPEGSNWSYELKLDGYRALAVKTGGSVRLRSRNDNDFNRHYPGVVRALEALPDETIRAIVNRIPDDYMSPTHKNTVIDGLIHRKPRLPDFVKQNY